MKIDENFANSQIDPSVLAPKSDLLPKIWNLRTKKLNDNVKIKLKQIANDFIRGFKYPLNIKDIILTGSTANYNWNQYSDIDLHVLVDFDEIPNEYMQAFKDYFNSKKEVWNKNHNITIMEHEVELYVQDASEPHYSTGVYSVVNDRWIAEPQIKKQDINYDDVTSKTEYFIKQISNLSKLLINKEYEKTITGIKNMKNKIKKYRQAGLENDGELSTENLVFKMLRNQGYLEQLSNLNNQAYDSDMGIEEEIINLQKALLENKKNINKLKESLSAILELDKLILEKAKKKKKGKKDACYYRAKAKYKVWPSAYASGYLVRCRNKKGKIKEDLNEEEEELQIDDNLLEDLAQQFELDKQILEINEEELSEIINKDLNEKSDFSKEKSQGLHGWFSRQGGKGKGKGWVDCNTCRKDKKTGRKTCKTCGRQDGEKRSKYPACRPTPSACTKTGMKSKKSSKQVSWKSKKEE